MSGYESGAAKRKRKREEDEAHNKLLKNMRTLQTLWGRSQDQPFHTKKSAAVDPTTSSDAQGETSETTKSYVEHFSRNYFVKDVPMNGDCMFSCLALALGLPLLPDSVLKLRREIVKYMRDNHELISGIRLKEHPALMNTPIDDIDENHLTTMAKPGEWGDGVVLSYACRLYKKSIQVILDDQVIRFEEETSNNLSENPIILGFVKSSSSRKNNHYVHLEIKQYQPDNLNANASLDNLVQPSNPMDSDRPTASVDLTSTPEVEKLDVPNQPSTKNNVVNVPLQPTVCSDSQFKLPDCWNNEQYVKFKTDNDWMNVNEGYLGCSVCHSASVDSEWAKSKVSASGSTPSSRMKSLRNKIYKHRDSKLHIMAVEQCKKIQEESLKASLEFQLEEQHTETCRVFRTAYCVAKNDRPYTDHPDLVQLQECNNIDMGRVLHSNVVCADIIDHIANEMREKMIKNIIMGSRHFAVLIDESTSIARNSCLIIYLRATLVEEVGPVTFFFDIVQLSSTDASGIESSLLQCLLDRHKFKIEFLRENWVGLGIDGASVMLGHKLGVSSRLKEKFPLIVSWHCFNHRLELAVDDAVKSCTEVNHFHCFMDTLYSLYSMSPKCQRELAEYASEVEVQLLRIGRVLSVRWVASSCRAVRAVWELFPALHRHFHSKCSDISLNSKERSKFSGLAKKLENSSFIKNLGLMYDALEELSDLSLALQKSDITLSSAQKLISREIEVLLSRKSSISERYAEACACEGVECGYFKGVPISESKEKLKPINKNQFYQALADSMTARLMPESDKPLCRAVEMLNPASFPDDIPAEFGEEEIKLLCQKFNFSFADIKWDYRKFKDSKGRTVELELQRLANCVNTIPVSTAPCERGFSKMNLVCTSARSKLTTQHLSSLMFLSITGPPLSDWKPERYVKSWLLSNRRDATSTQGPCKMIKQCDDPGLKSIWDCMQ